MDEVDGMSAGDRGGVGALNALIKKSKVDFLCFHDTKSEAGATDSYNMHCERPASTKVEAVDEYHIQPSLPQVCVMIVWGVK